MRSDRKTYILDTSVLLADPGAFRRFGEHEVVLPVVAVAELESKRHHPELGWAARRVLRALEELRVSFGGLGEPVPVNDEGRHLARRAQPRRGRGSAAALSDSPNDGRILAVARNLAAEGRSVVLISKDLPLRLRASLIGIDAEEYRNEQAVENGWTGTAELSVDPATVDLLFRAGTAEIAAARDLPCHTGLVLSAGRQSALGRVTADKMARLVCPDRALFGVSGRSAEQRIALDLLADSDVGIVSLGGSAGTGKSALALAAGLEAVLERRTHRKLIVFRPIFAVGGQELGFVPGTETEKMRGWGLAVFDTLDAIVGANVVDEVVHRGLLEVLPLTHIRGRSLHDTFVIVDEAQNLERMVLLTALSRMGQRTRCVLTHDVAQRDNLRVGRHDGVLSVVEMLKGHPLRARDPGTFGAQPDRRIDHVRARPRGLNATGRSATGWTTRCDLLKSGPARLPSSPPPRRGRTSPRCGGRCWVRFGIACVRPGSTADAATSCSTWTVCRLWRSASCSASRARLRAALWHPRCLAGTTATTVHRGAFGDVGAAHDAVVGWCAARGFRLSGVRWEVYGPHDDHPAGQLTEVYWLLA